MAATPVCTGPVAAWVQAGVSPALFFGYGVVGPQSTIFARWTKVMSDRTGSMVARDKMYQGQEALIFIEFAEWNDVVREAVAATPVPAYGKAGANGFSDVGTLAITEGVAFSLILVYPYSFSVAGHPAFNASSGANKLVNGYRFFGVTMEQMIWKPGTQPNSVVCQFHANPVLTAASGALVLYDHNVTAAATLTP